MIIKLPYELREKILLYLEPKDLGMYKNNPIIHTKYFIDLYIKKHFLTKEYEHYIMLYYDTNISHMKYVYNKDQIEYIIIEMFKNNVKIHYLNEAMLWCVFYGHLNVIKYLYSVGFRPDTSVIDNAIEKDDIDIIKYMASIGYFPTEEGVRKSLCNPGHLEIFKFLHSTGYSFSPYSMGYPVSSGHIETVKFFHSIGYKCSYNSIDEAAGKGYFEIIKFLYYNDCGIFSYRTMDAACKGGHLEIVEFLHSINKLGSSQSVHNAIRHGHTDILKFLKSIDFKFPTDAMLCASKISNIEILKFLKSIGFVYIPETLMYSAKLGNVEVTKLVYSETKVQDKNKLFNFAVKSGSLEMVKFLYKSGIDPAYISVLSAAECGFLNIVEFIYPIYENASSINTDGNLKEINEKRKRTLIRNATNNTKEFIINKK